MALPFDEIPPSFVEWYKKRLPKGKPRSMIRGNADSSIEDMISHIESGAILSWYNVGNSSVRLVLSLLLEDGYIDQAKHDKLARRYETFQERKSRLHREDVEHGLRIKAEVQRLRTNGDEKEAKNLLWRDRNYYYYNLVLTPEEKEAEEAQERLKSRESFGEQFGVSSYDVILRSIMEKAKAEYFSNFRAVITVKPED